MYRKFKSLTNDQFGYSFDTTTSSYSSTGVIESKFRMFHTYGDRMIQHSGDWPVAVEHLADYLVALATDLLEYDNEDYYREVSYCVTDVPRYGAIEFAASVVFKESDKDWTKRRYVSMGEQKMGTRKAKEHDKRYIEIEPWMDGFATAIYRLVLPEYSDGLRKYCYARAIREWASQDQSKAHLDGRSGRICWLVQG